MRYLVDMDGVIADFERGFLESWKKNYPSRSFVPLGQRKTFYPEDQYPEEFKKDVEGITLVEGFFLNLPPMEGGLEALTFLAHEGKDIWICTAPVSKNPYCAQEKLLWIQKYLGETFRRKTIITKDKTLIRGDILIDDRPELTGADKPSWEQVLYSQPYNLQVSKRRLTWESYREVLGM